MSRTAGGPYASTRELSLMTDDGARLAVSKLSPPVPVHDTTVVLSHGWAASRSVWGPVSERLLADGFSVLTYDQRGHGASTLGREPVGIDRLARDLATVLGELPGGDFVIAGHSGGGFAAISYAIDYASASQGSLRGLALLGTAAHDQNTSAGEVKMMGNPVFSWAVSRRWLGRKMLGQMMGKHPEPAAMELNRQLFAATPARVRAEYFACTHDMDLRPGLASVTVPTVVLAGEADTVVKPDLGRVLAEAMPLARFESLPQLGHVLPLEAPDRVANVIADLAR